MNYRNILFSAILAAVVIGIIQVRFVAASDNNSNDIKVRLRKAEMGADPRLLKELCASADPSDLNIADALDEETALFMLERGADVNKQCEVCRNEWPNDRETTALHAAAKWNSTRLIDALLKKGAKVDATGKMDKDTPLQVAAYDGNAEAVERLLKAGANPNLKCAYGNALTCAVFEQLNGYPRDPFRNERYLKTMKLLVAAGADVNGALDNGESIKDMLLKNHNTEFMQQARLICGMAKPSDKTADLTSQQVAETLTNTDIKTLPGLAPLLKYSDADVRARALELMTELASNTSGDNPTFSMTMMLVELEGSARPMTLVDCKLFGPQLISSIIAATNDPEPKVRIKALRVLRIFKTVDEEIIKVVTGKLNSDSDPKVRLCAAATLCCFAKTQRLDASSAIEESIRSACTHDADAPVKIGSAIIFNFLHDAHEASPTKNPKVEASKPNILAIEFGRALGFQAIEMREARSIPCVHDSRGQAAFRFCMVLDSRQKAPHIKLKLTLPEKRSDWSFEHHCLVPGFDATWQSSGAVKVSADGKVGTYEDSFSQGCYGMYGLYAATWPVDKETIPGKYKLEVFLNDQLEKTYDFDVVQRK